MMVKSERTGQNRLVWVQVYNVWETAIHLEYWQQVTDNVQTVGVICDTTEIEGFTVVIVNSMVLWTVSVVNSKVH